MIDVTKLEEVGTPVPDDPNQTSWEPYSNLEDYLRNWAGGLKIADIGVRAHGILRVIDDDMRKNHPIVGDAHAVLWYTDAAMFDATTGMNLVDETTAKMLTYSVSAVIEDIIEHYQKCPLDDGNPAYRLFQNWLADNTSDARATG